MAAPIKNNLPPASQQWVRDMERRVAALERQNQLLQVTANKNATTIGAVQSALRDAQAAIQMQQSGASVDSNSHLIFSGGSGEFFIGFTRPAWANRVVVLTTVGLSMMSESPSNGWEAHITGRVFRSVGGTNTLLGTVAGTSATIQLGGNMYQVASDTGTFDSGTLDSNVTGIVLGGQWSTHLMPSSQSNATFSISSLALWYASTEEE